MRRYMYTTQWIAVLLVAAVGLIAGCKDKSAPPAAPSGGGSASQAASSPTPTPAPGPTGTPRPADAPLPVLELVADVDGGEIFEGDPLRLHLRLRSPRLLQSMALAAENATSAPAAAAPAGPDLSGLPADWAKGAKVTLERIDKGQRSAVFSAVPVGEFVAAGSGHAFPASASAAVIVPPEKSALKAGSYVLTVTCPPPPLAAKEVQLPAALTAQAEFSVVPAGSPAQRSAHAGRLARLAHHQQKFDEAARLAKEALAVVDAFNSDCLDMYLILADSLIGSDKFDDALAAYDELIAVAKDSPDAQEIAKQRKQKLESLIRKQAPSPE